MTTCQPVPFWVSRSAWAFSTSVPSTPTGPSTNFSTAVVLATGHDESLVLPLPALARRFGLLQSRAANSAWSAWVAASTLGLADGEVGCRTALADWEPLPEGVGSAFSASVTARPWDVAEDDGLAESPDSGEFASSLPELDGLGSRCWGWCSARRSGSGVAGPLGCRTGRKYSFAVVPTCSRASSESVPLGMLTMMLSSPWVWTSASDTPRPLTRRFMISTAVSMLVLLIALGSPGSLIAVSVMLVPPARSIPRRGVVCPEANIPPVSATRAIRMRASARPGLLWALALRPFFGAATFSYSLSGRRARGQRGDGHDWCRESGRKRHVPGARAVLARTPGT